MEKFSIKEVIEQAVQTEKLGYKFYNSMAKRFKENDKLKELFEILAEKELQHEKTFSELKEITGDEEPEGWEVVSQYLRAIVESEFFLGQAKSLLLLKDMKTAAEAIHLAIGFEKETLLYFYSIRKLIKETRIIDEVINEEKNHIIWLNNFIV
ncbi:MAG: ferritin family protein [Nitrospinota bacterium]